MRDLDERRFHQDERRVQDVGIVLCEFMLSLEGAGTGDAFNGVWKRQVQPGAAWDAGALRPIVVFGCERLAIEQALPRSDMH